MTAESTSGSWPDPGQLEEPKPLRIRKGNHKPKVDRRSPAGALDLFFIEVFTKKEAN